MLKKNQIITDKIKLEQLTEKTVNGMAYPFNCVDEDMIKIMQSCGLKYGRIGDRIQNFILPKDLYRWQPTVHHNDKNIFNIIDEFLSLDLDNTTLLYIWGHSYEFDVDDNWQHIEKICKILSGRKDIWYCTNADLANEISIVNL